MSHWAYHNFDLTIRSAVGGGYRVEIDSRGGQPVRDIAWPFTAADLEQLWESITGPARDLGLPPTVRPTPLAEYQTKVKTFGERMFDAIFADTVLVSYNLSLEKARLAGEGIGLRIRLHLTDVPELAQYPWEYLFNTQEQKFVALTDKKALVRHLRLNTPSTALLVNPPLNILVMIADPTDYPRLKAQEEWDAIKSAFAQLEKDEWVKLYKVPKPTVDGLHQELSQRHHHIFHFIGHGDFDENNNSEPVLLMEDDNGQGDLVGIDRLSVVLDHDSLRLVVLNSCEGAKASKSDPFSGLAQRLVKQRIPAAIAMQFKITDKAANNFASKFYQTIVNDHPIDAAMAVARRAIFLANNPTEWATPILFMNSEDGQLFQVEVLTEEQKRQQQIMAWTEEARFAITNRNYAMAIQKLQAIVTLLQTPLSQPVAGPN